MEKRIKSALEAIKFVTGEQSRMQKLIDMVRGKMKIVPRIDAVPDMKQLTDVVFHGNMPNMGITTNSALGGRLGILYTPGITMGTVTKDEGLAGMIAHEVGHYVNGDVGRNPEGFSSTKLRETEYAADKVAYKAGYGPGLIAAFEELGSKMPVVLEHVSKTHPALSDRIRRLRAYDDEGREVAA